MPASIDLSVSDRGAPSLTRAVVCFLSFQLGWLACVLGAAHAQPWLGVLVAGIIVLFHCITVPMPQRELVLQVITLIVGVVWDSAVASSSAITFAFQPSMPIAPAWILGLWGLFATTLNVSLRWLRGRWLLAALLGAVFGPLSYLSGQRLGALQFADTPAAMMVIGAGWALIMPLLSWLSIKFDGFGRSAGSAPAADGRGESP